MQDRVQDDTRKSVAAALTKDRLLIGDEFS